jgi:hypothetical protein
VTEIARPRRLWLAAGLVAAAELATASLMLWPRVDPAYRAYFIDKSSDCWPHQTPAAYVLGTRLSFVVGQRPDFMANKICGWFYPEPTGTWSYGAYSLMRFVMPPPGAPLVLTLTAGAMVIPAHPTQRVVVSVNGQELASLDFETTDPATRMAAIPEALADTGRLDLRFDYPDARSGREMGPNQDFHLRALRMVALTLSKS